VSSADLAQQERRALCDLLLEVGPDHPTLCEGWATADLAAHLVLRERRPVAAMGIVVRPMASHTEKVQAALRDRTPYEELVATVRKGPPAPLRPFDGAMNTGEYFIHHEDVRRADGTSGPREGIDELEAALWAGQGRRTRFLTRGLDDIDLTLVNDAGERKHVGGGSRPVTLRGRPGELTLFLSGRRRVARVELEGDPAAVEEVRTGTLGL
jgi:uncharacterized protein (TIGR03085 family)